MELKDCTVKINGRKWRITFREFGDSPFAGLTDNTARLIEIRNDNNNNVKDFDVEIARTIRHELIHAFLYECGLGEDWRHEPQGHEETVVDWLALMYPKIHRVFKKLGIEKTKGE